MASSVEVRTEAAPAAANQRSESLNGANLRNTRKSRTWAAMETGSTTPSSTKVKAPMPPRSL
jgi:hypothetical protein